MGAEPAGGTRSPLSPADAFRQAYRTNLWGGGESPSGPGSSLDQTAGLRQAIPELCGRYEVTTLLDLPCGDGHWMGRVALPGIRYLGADLLPEVVARAAARNPERTFLQLDLTTSPLPPADLLLCRDCLVHLSFNNIQRALARLRGSGSRLLIATTFTDHDRNEDAIDGDWRLLNLERAPFALPPPIAIINEGCTEEDGCYADKSLAVWRLADLP